MSVSFSSGCAKYLDYFEWPLFQQKADLFYIKMSKMILVFRQLHTFRGHIKQNE